MEPYHDPTVAFRVVSEDEPLPSSRLGTTLEDMFTATNALTDLAKSYGPPDRQPSCWDCHDCTDHCRWLKSATS